MIGGFQPVAFQPAYQQEASVRRGGGKGRRPWVRYGEYKRPKLNAEIDEILDEVSAEMLYREVVETAPQPVVAKAQEIVKPFKEAKTVDWLALEEDARRVGRLVELWRQEQLRIRRKQELADEEWFMLGD